MVTRTAIVTGAARGIGASIAQRLASDGHRVAVLDIDESACADTSDAIVATGGTAIAIGADVTQESAVIDAVDRVSSVLGRPTILVNNAGIIRDNLLHKMSIDDWDSVTSVHLRGAFLMTRAVQSHMVGERYGRIVSLSSTSALGNRGQVNYSAAKAGLQGFTKALAIELGKFGVTANSVAPGFIETDMTKSTAKRLGLDFEQFRDTVVSSIPVGRSGLPADVAHAVSFLVDEQSGFISGQVIYVAGGPQD